MANTRKQGTGTTPRGTFTMTQAFGNAAEPGMWLPYHRVKSGDYWVEDNASRYYNTLRNKSQGGFRYWLPTANDDSSEYLPHYTTQYKYAVVINFNRAPDYHKAHRGAGIFLHVKGSGATAGCVRSPEPTADRTGLSALGRQDHHHPLTGRTRSADVCAGVSRLPVGPITTGSTVRPGWTRTVASGAIPSANSRPS